MFEVYECDACNRSFDNPGALGGHRNFCRNLTTVAERTDRNRKLNAASVKANTKPRIDVCLICQNPDCNVAYTLKLRQREINIGKYRKFCSRSCANKRSPSNETKNKTRQTLREGYRSGRLRSWSKGKELVEKPKRAKSGLVKSPQQKRHARLVDWQCKNCGKKKQTTWTDRHRKCCDKECARQLSSKCMAARARNGTTNGKAHRCIYIFEGKSVRCDSKIEYACLDYFTRFFDVLDIERCCESVVYHDFDDKQRRFTPDFVIRTTMGTFIIECKNHAIKIGKSLNKKWRKYKELIPYKKRALRDHALRLGFVPFWFTPNLHTKYYQSLFGKDLHDQGTVTQREYLGS